MMAKEKKKVPNLRFKGFTNDWEQRKLGEVILDYKRKNNNDRLPVLTSSFQGIEYQEKHFGSQQKHDTSDYNVLPKEYMTYRNRSDNGYFRFNINNLGVTGIVSKFYPVFTTINTNKLFLASYINHNHRLKNHFKVVSVGTSQHVLSLRNFKKTNLLFPSKDEQDQIGKFFNLLNRAITLQQRKLELLKQLKKGFLQKLFADKDSKQPVLRFKGFHDDWEQRKLGEISERILRKNSDLQSLLPLTISAQDGLVDQTIYFNKQVASKQLKNYLLLYNGDFAYNKSYSVGYPYGAIKRLDKYKQGVLSPLYIAFKPTNINSDFLQHYYDTDKWYREIYRNAAEGARNHGLLNISANDFFNSKLITPSDNDEQLKIAKIINVFNRLITLQQQKLAKYQSIKKSLLQQMFM